MFYRHDSQYSWYYSSPETFEVWEKTTQGRKKNFAAQKPHSYNISPSTTIAT